MYWWVCPTILLKNLDTQMHGQQMHEHRAMSFSTNCADIDECAVGLDSCDANAGCTNTDGSYECTCNSGYTGSGLSCSGNSHISDVNECI